MKNQENFNSNCGKTTNKCQLWNDTDVGIISKDFKAACVELLQGTVTPKEIRKLQKRSRKYNEWNEDFRTKKYNNWNLKAKYQNGGKHREKN